MALTFKTVSVTGTGSTTTGTAQFANTINTANVAIQSFKFNYGSDTDQYIDDIFITVSNVQVNAADNTVTWNWAADMQAEDDTTTSGGRTEITFLVIADVAAA